MRPKTFRLIEQSVDDGVKRGWKRAHKHDDTPSEEFIINAISAAVIEEICEWFSFEDDYYDRHLL